MIFLPCYRLIFLQRKPIMEQIIIKPNGRVYLYLPYKSYKPIRQIGGILEGVFYTTRSSQKNQKYNCSNTIGFCYKFINDGNFELVCVEYDFQKMWTSREAILKNSIFTNYEKNGLEKQIHLGLGDFKLTRQEAEEERAVIIKQRQERLEYEKQCGQKKRNKNLQLALNL